MSTSAVGNKRASSSEITAVAGGDHRKRRRNRTTQSCMNCHSSKRMCDRKRPCGRCTQLGLTGLCVYQVDEANQSANNEPQDENSRLQKRVAELESLIRELKNKPHPRWSRAGSESAEKLQPPSSGSTSPGDASPRQHHAEDFTSTKPSSIELPPRLPMSTGHSVFTPGIQLATPAASTPTSSPATIFESIPDQLLESPTTPMDTFIPNAEHSLLDTDTLKTLIDQIAYSDTGPTFGWMNEECAHGHCGCLHDSISYGVVLELSLRLRKAAERLQHHSNHRSGSLCPLTQRIIELDRFASNTLGNSVAPPDFHSSMHTRHTRQNHSWPITSHGFESMLTHPTSPCEVQLPGQSEAGWNHYSSM